MRPLESLPFAAGSSVDGKRVSTWPSQDFSKPLRWKRPRFVVLAFDLFSAEHSHDYIAACFGVMAAAPQHTFCVLTSHAERMERWFYWASYVHGSDDPSGEITSRLAIDSILLCRIKMAEQGVAVDWDKPGASSWPISNVWVGISDTNQLDIDQHRVGATLSELPPDLRIQQLPDFFKSAEK